LLTQRQQCLLGPADDLAGDPDVVVAGLAQQVFKAQVRNVNVSIDSASSSKGPDCQE
jgi:hypothetical protein